MNQVRDVMTRGVRTLSPNDTMQLAAQAMDELNVGFVPVCDGSRLVGTLTDRDIVLRGVAQGLPADRTQVKDVMSGNVRWCTEDQSVEEIAAQMQQAKIRRLPVVDGDKHLIGVVALGDLASKGEEPIAGAVLNDVSQPSAPDRSSQSAASGPAGGGKGKPVPAGKRGKAG